MVFSLVQICNQPVAGSTPITSSIIKIKGLDVKI